jgi:hypothetical protein
MSPGAKCPLRTHGCWALVWSTLPIVRCR